MRVEFDPDAGSKAPAYSGRVVKILDKMKARAFAVYRTAADGSGRALPVEKQGRGPRILVPAGMAGDAKDGDLVAIEPLREGALGLAARARRRDHRLGQVRARGEPHRARDPSYSACLLARGAERGRRRAARSA